MALVGVILISIYLLGRLIFGKLEPCRHRILTDEELEQEFWELARFKIVKERQKYLRDKIKNENKRG